MAATGPRGLDELHDAMAADSGFKGARVPVDITEEMEPMMWIAGRHGAGSAQVTPRGQTVSWEARPAAMTIVSHGMAKWHGEVAVKPILEAADAPGVIVSGEERSAAMIREELHPLTDNATRGVPEVPREKVEDSKLEAADAPEVIVPGEVRFTAMTIESGRVVPPVVSQRRESTADS